MSSIASLKENFRNTKQAHSALLAQIPAAERSAIKGAVFEKEAALSLSTLGGILDPLDEDAAMDEGSYQLLNTFLADRWDRTRGSCWGYTGQPDGYMTRLCLAAAQLLHQFHPEKTVYQHLIPGLQHWEDKLGILEHSVDTYALGQLVLDGSQSLLPVGDMLAFLSPENFVDPSQPESYRHHIQNPLSGQGLDPELWARMLGHSDASRQLESALKRLQAARRDSNSLYFHLDELRKNLLAGGRTLGGDEGATELQASASAFEGVIRFGAYWKALPAGIRQEVGGFESAPGQPFTRIIEVLFEDQGNTDRSQADRTCVEVMAGKIETILQTETYKTRLEAIQSDDAQANLIKLLKENIAQLKATLKDEGYRGADSGPILIPALFKALGLEKDRELLVQILNITSTAQLPELLQTLDIRALLKGLNSYTQTECLDFLESIQWSRRAALIGYLMQDPDWLSELDLPSKDAWKKLLSHLDTAQSKQLLDLRGKTLSQALNTVPELRDFVDFGAFMQKAACVFQYLVNSEPGYLARILNTGLGQIGLLFGRLPVEKHQLIWAVLTHPDHSPVRSIAALETLWAEIDAVDNAFDWTEHMVACFKLCIPQFLQTSQGGEISSFLMLVGPEQRARIVECILADPALLSKIAQTPVSLADFLNTLDDAQSQHVFEQLIQEDGALSRLLLQDPCLPSEEAGSLLGALNSDQFNRVYQNFGNQIVQIARQDFQNFLLRFTNHSGYEESVRKYRNLIEQFAHHPEGNALPHLIQSQNDLRILIFCLGLDYDLDYCRRVFEYLEPRLVQLAPSLSQARQLAHALKPDTEFESFFVAFLKDALARHTRETRRNNLSNGLEAYKNNRSDNPKEYAGFFSQLSKGKLGGSSRTDKLSAVAKLQQALNNNEIVPDFTKGEVEALRNGHLSGLFQDAKAFLSQTQLQAIDNPADNGQQPESSTAHL